jgi:transcriptional regulator of arginine metabolism
MKTVPGGATAVATAVEQAAWSEVIGAIPGGDNVLLVTRSEVARKAIERRIESAKR